MKLQHTILYRNPKEDARDDFARCTVHRVREIRETLLWSEEVGYNPWENKGFLIDIPEPVEGTNGFDWRLNTYRIESQKEWEDDFLKGKFQPIADQLGVFIPTII